MQTLPEISALGGFLCGADLEVQIDVLPEESRLFL